MIWNGHRQGSCIGSPLHYNVAAPLSDDLESMLLEDAADVSAGEDAELTHAPLQSG